MTSRVPLVFNVYAPALGRDDRRTLAVVHGLERALPGLRLDWRVTEKRGLAALPQRDEWLTEAARHGEFPLVCNGDERFPVTIHGLHRSAYVSPGGRPQLQVHAKLPLDSTVIAAAGDVLEHVAEGALAFWGHASPMSFGAEVSDQLRRSAHGPEHSPRGLPMLNLPEKLRAPEIPHHLGWLNYWSPGAAQAIGFPDPSRDADLLTRARRTTAGGWIMRLTDAPLDYDEPSHLDALKRAYERFPEIGGRAAP